MLTHVNLKFKRLLLNHVTSSFGALRRARARRYKKQRRTAAGEASMDTQTLGGQAEDLWIEKYRAAIAAAPQKESRGIDLRTVFDHACGAVARYATKIVNQMSEMRMSRLRIAALGTMRDLKSERLSPRPVASSGDVARGTVVS